MNETRQRRRASRAAAWWLGAAMAGGVLLAGGEASATITLGTPQAILPTGYTRPSTRPIADQYWISYEDCKNNVQLRWVVQTTDASFSWAASVLATCPIAPGTISANILQACWQPSTGASNLPNSTVVTINAQDLVAGTLGITDCDPTTLDGGLGVSWPVAINIYFYYPSTNPTDTTTWMQTSIALQGPQAPPAANLSLGVGDQELIAGLPVPPTDTNTFGYYFYCYPVGGDAGTVTTGGSGGTGGTSTGSTTSTGGASTGGAGGSDAGSADSGTSTGTGGTSTGTGSSTSTSSGATNPEAGVSSGPPVVPCAAGITIPDLNTNNPDPNSPWLCGNLANNTSASFNIQSLNNLPLQDGIPYAIGIAAYDAVGNVGPLSPLYCATPLPIQGFFLSYCEDNGPGCENGCGSCNVGGRADSLWPALGGLALASAIMMARRDRRRLSSQPRNRG